VVVLATTLALLASSSDGYEIVTYPLPDDVVLEVGGIELLEDGRPIVCTRRGEVFVVDGAFTSDPADVRFTKFAEGLHEPLGLLRHDGWIYTVQRSELSRMRDTNGDDRIDELETVCDAWTVSGNYHEYNFGPRLGPDGDLWITTNKPFGSEPFGRVDWRGFALRIGLDGSMQPMSCGLRSPAGLERSPWGQLFTTDNQGEWCGASKLSLLAPGSFHGHPWGLFSCEKGKWTFDVPEHPPDGLPMPEVAERMPTFQLPAVWFPYDKAGRSPSGFCWDRSEGVFGPFAGQLFVGDQYAATVMRVALEEVDGHWQGAVFPFVSGLLSGVTRVRQAPDGSLLVGMSSRGWPALGRAEYGLERIVWTGETPFAIRSMSVREDGFALSFTVPLERASALERATFTMTSYTYLLHAPYGSDETDTRELDVRPSSLTEDGYALELVVDGLRAGYVHELAIDGLTSVDGRELDDSRVFYTLVRR